MFGYAILLVQNYRIGHTRAQALPFVPVGPDERLPPHGPETVNTDKSGG
jgi:hypothetical protein